MELQLTIPQQRINAFCQRWKIIKLELFGSAIRDDFSTDSDIDLLVEYDPNFHRTLADMEAMHQEIEGIFLRPVDLVVRKTIENSPNPYKRENILTDTVTLYG
mgnify:CR=1 FL=1